MKKVKKYKEVYKLLSGSKRAMKNQFYTPRLTPWGIINYIEEYPQLVRFFKHCQCFRSLISQSFEFERSRIIGSIAHLKMYV